LLRARFRAPPIGSSKEPVYLQANEKRNRRTVSKSPIGTPRDSGQMLIAALGSCGALTPKWP
jgi:hypothetical protein